MIHIIVLAAVLPVCFAQELDEQSNAPASSSAVKGTPAKKIPLDPAGDPLFAPLATSPPTLHEKFMDYAVLTFGPRALLTPAFFAGVSMLSPPRGYPREWRQGIGGYGRMYGSKIATATTQRTARFMAAALLHEDFRYRPSTSTGFARAVHAIGFAFVDQSDSGHRRLAVANFVGAAAGGLVQELYMPPGYNTLSRAERHMLFTFIGYAAQNLTREFAPDVFRFTSRFHTPFPRIPIPEWWVKRR